MTISGYPSTTSVIPGESIDFHLSSDSSAAANLVVERIGIASIPGPSVSVPLSESLQHFSPPALNAWEGFGWPAAVSFPVPATWPTGLYRLTDGSSEVFTFVVRPQNPGVVCKVLLHVSFLTPTAYNAEGGKSLYGYNSSPTFDELSRASRVSFDRPGSTPRSGSWEAMLISWLEAEGIAIEYCSSVDLHAIPNLLANYDCLVIAGHDEYWTKSMRDHAERFVGNGGNVIVLSGNTCYRAVRLERANRLVVFHKYAGDDPSPNNDEATVAWAEPPLNRPQNSLLGVAFTEGAWNGGSTAYSIRFPSHWVFAGVSAATTSPLMNYETDAAAYVEEPEGYPRVTGAEGTPLAFTVLASADLRSWSGKPGRATMGIYSRNGTVFNAATTEWITALQADSVVAQVTRNVFGRLSNASRGTGRTSVTRTSAARLPRLMASSSWPRCRTNSGGGILSALTLPGVR